MRRGVSLGASVAWVLAGYNLHWKVYPDTFAVDFRIYYHAALGDPNWHPQYAWLYHDAIRWLFVPFTWLPESLATAIWMVAMFACYLAMIWKVSSYEHGWLVVLATTVPFGFQLALGNVAPLLALLLTTAAGSYLSVAVKPHLVLFALLRAVAEHRRRSMAAGSELRHADLSVSAVPTVPERKDVVDRMWVRLTLDGNRRIADASTNDGVAP